MARGKKSGGGKPGFKRTGPNGEMEVQHDANGDGGNQYDIKKKTEQLAKGLEALDEQFAKLEAKSKAYRKQCEPEREEIKAIKKALVDANVAAPAALNAIIRQHRLLDQADRVDENLDDELKEEFATLSDALADFIHTPLFAAAAAAEAKKQSAPAAERKLEPVD